MPGKANDVPSSESRIRLRNPGELVAAVPHLLGFYPGDSLVLVTRHGRRSPGVVVRTDLPQQGDDQALADQLLQHLRQSETDEVIVAIIGGGSADPPDPPPRQDLARRVAETLTTAGVRIACCVWAEEIRHGASWRCYGDIGPVGTVPDPQSSPLAAEVVLAGAVTFASREDLAAQLAPDADTAVLARRAALLAEHTDIAAVDRALGGPSAARVGIAALRDAIHQAAHGELPVTDEQIIPLTVALSDPRVGDAATVLCLPDPAAAERLWLALTRAVPAPYRAEPAVLLAITAYVRGNGALARAALATADTAAPGRSFADLLSRALNVSMPPTELRALITDGAARNVHR